MRHEVRANGDVVLYWANGKQALKLQHDGFLLAAGADLQATHPLDGLAGELDLDTLDVIEGWARDAREVRGGA